MKAKGPERCLIVRQDNAKMLADLGGAIYFHLSSASGVASIESKLTQFLGENL